MAVGGSENKATSRNIASTETTKSYINEGGNESCSLTSQFSSLFFYRFRYILVAAISFGAGLLTPQFTSHLLQAKTRNNTPQSRQRQQVTLSRHTTTTTTTITAENDMIRPLFPCSDEVLSQFWHESFIPGMHLVCMGQRNDKKSSDVQLQFYAGSVRRRVTKLGAVAPRWSDLRQSMTQQLKLRPTDNTLHQPWAVFSPIGEYLVDESVEDDNDSCNNAVNCATGIVQKLVQTGVVLIFQGGQWIWPGVRIGFQRSVDLSRIVPERSLKGDSMLLLNAKAAEVAAPQPNRSTAWLETLSLQPLVISVQGFLTDYECDYIQAKAEPDMRYSEVTLMDKNLGRAASDFRASQSTFVKAGSDPVLTDIEHRTSSLVRVPRQHQEHVQVLRYGVTEHYSAHHDYFDPDLYRSDFFTQLTIQNGRRNRMATVFWYLTDVEKGGETFFSRYINATAPEDNLDDCSQVGGLKVKPQRGKVIIFYSMTSEGRLDPLSLHGACPVEKGIKWAANKWVWNAPMEFIRDEVLMK